jgi:hypothetical protein
MLQSSALAKSTKKSRAQIKREVDAVLAKEIHWRKGEPALFWAGTGYWVPVVIREVTSYGNPRIVHPTTGKLTVVRKKALLEKPSAARRGFPQVISHARKKVWIDPAADVRSNKESTLAAVLKNVFAPREEIPAWSATHLFVLDDGTKIPVRVCKNHGWYSAFEADGTLWSGGQNIESEWSSDDRNIEAVSRVIEL